jgi:hypothetical protein
VSCRLGNSISLRYKIGVSALKNLNDSEDINCAWENIKENIRTSAKESLGLYELKQHEAWLDEECLEFLDQRKQVNLLAPEFYIQILAQPVRKM